MTQVGENSPNLAPNLVALHPSVKGLSENFGIQVSENKSFYQSN
jgi:hypothetical protein